MRQVERVPDKVQESDLEGRTDLRGIQMVTIDGEDAKDLDDAVSLTIDGTHYHLGVHIADVANYVQEKSALDREALTRGTSVYLADRVIPMLPMQALKRHLFVKCGRRPAGNELCSWRLTKKEPFVDHEIVEICDSR